MYVLTRDQIRCDFLNVISLNEIVVELKILEVLECFA